MNTFNRDLSQVRLRWLDRALEHVQSAGIESQSALHAARYPDHTTVEPSLPGDGSRWYAERRRKGDVTVIVGFPPGETPIIWGVYYNLPMPRVRRAAGNGAGGRTSYPTTSRELRRRIIEAGYVIKSGGKHDRIETPDGRLVTTLAGTPSDFRGMMNAVKELHRKGIDVSR